MADETETTTTTLENVTTTTTAPAEGTTSHDLEGGSDATDALGMKKNVVGPLHDQAPADNSPTTEDVHGDLQENIETSRNEGFNRGLKEQSEAQMHEHEHPYQTKNGVTAAAPR